MVLTAFRPNTAATVTHAVTTTSTTPTALVGGGDSVMLTNTGGVAFVALGTSAIAASTTTSFPMLSGEVLVLGRHKDATHVVAITASGTSTLYVTTGEGV